MRFENAIHTKEFQFKFFLGISLIFLWYLLISGFSLIQIGVGYVILIFLVAVLTKERFRNFLIRIFSRIFQKEKDKKVSTIVNILKKFRTNRVIHSEHELQVGLEQHLKAHFHVVPEFRIDRSNIIDFAVDRNYGVEIKVAKSNNVLRNLLGQVDEYKSNFSKVIIYIFDYGEGGVDVKYYKNKLVQMGCLVVVAKGRFLVRD